MLSPPRGLVQAVLVEQLDHAKHRPHLTRIGRPEGRNALDRSLHRNSVLFSVALTDIGRHTNVYTCIAILCAPVDSVIALSRLVRHCYAGSSHSFGSTSDRHLCERTAKITTTINLPLLGLRVIGSLLVVVRWVVHSPKNL